MISFTKTHLMKNYWLIFLLFISTSFCSFSQYDEAVNEAISDNDEQKMYDLANVLMLDGYLYRADTLVEALLKIDNENPEFNYFKGIIELYSFKNHRASIPFFEKSTTKVEGRINLFNIETDVTNDTYFHLGSVYHYLKDFDKAEEYYQTFKERCKKSSQLYKATDVRLAQCQVARKQIADSLDVNFIPVNINSAAQEYSSVISANGKELYFTSRRAWVNIDQKYFIYPVDNSYPEDIFFSKGNGDGVWSEPTILPLCEANKNESSVSLTPDMTMLYVYSDSLGNGDIFVSNYDDGYKKIEDLTYKKLNTKDWETHSVVTQDSSIIIFSSDRKHGYGGRDLWIIHKQEDSTWSKPVNMGADINSEQDEDAPFLTLDNKTLYYSTNGSQSMGGFDILKSDFKNDQWSQGENLGYPINSTGDDIYYTVTSNGIDGYYTSFREGGKGEKDIYHVNYNDAKADDVIALSGGVINITEDAEEIDLIVTLINKTDNKNIPVSVKENDFFTLLEDCKDYSLEMKNSENDEVVYNEDFKTNCTNSSEHLEKYYYNGQYWIDGLVADEAGESIENATIELIDKKTGETIATVNSDENGKFKEEDFKDLRPGDSMNVSLKVSADNYASNQFEIDTLLGQHGDIAVNYVLKGDNLNDMLAQHIIYFEYDKSSVTKSESDILDQVIVLLNDNPEMNIVVQSYTDCRGTDKYNQRLSERRAKTASKYIKAKITNPERVTNKGMGEKYPVDECNCDDEDKSCTEEQYKDNRRTTFEVVEEEK